jgi:hypothetical protein
MKIVQGDELEWVRGLEHRGGTFHFRRLMEGTPGRLDNFQLSMGRLDKDFVSPRHRHNFEQIRFQLEGELDFARNGKMTPGTVGFFPEGAAYGPQTSEVTATTIVLQFGGASGGGYLSRNEVKKGMDELAQYGTFEGGVFRRHDGIPGKRNMDGYEAIWSHVNGRELEYPKPRYPKPLMMSPENFEWVALPGQPGVQQKLLGVFTERRAQAAFYKLDAGATLRASGRGIYVACAGDGEVAGQPLRRFTTVFLDHGEEVSIAATSETELIHFGLPDLRDMAALPQAAAVAAE